MQAPEGRNRHTPGRLLSNAPQSAGFRRAAAAARRDPARPELGSRNPPAAAAE